MSYDPVHYRKTWRAIGNPEDPMAISTGPEPESMISLLKGIYASLGGGVPLPDFSVPLTKLQFIEEQTLLGNAKPFDGPVTTIKLGSHLEWKLNPGADDSFDLKKLSITTDDIADATIINQKVVDHSIDLRTKAAGMTPNRLMGTDPSGLIEMVMAGPGLRLRVPDVPPLVIEIGPSYITEDFIAGGAIIDPHIADRQIRNRHIIDHSIDILGKSLPSTPGKLMGTNGSTGYWQTVTVGTGLVYDAINGILASTSGPGTGTVTTQLPVNSFQLAGFKDSTGTVIKGLDVPPSGGITVGPTTVGITAGGITGSMIAQGAILDGNVAALTLDLSRVARQAAPSRLWGTRDVAGDTIQVSIGAGLTYFNGVLSSGGGHTTSGSVTTAMLAGWADNSGTVLQGIAMPSEGLAVIAGNLTLRNDLASLEAASTFGIYQRSAADTWSVVSVTQGLSLAGGTLGIVHPTLVSVMNIAAGNIAADKVPYFTSAIGGTAMNTFTATSFARGLMSNADAPTFRAGIAAQAQDADLDSLAAAATVNSIYYRSAANTWAPVTIGTNLTFTGGTLSATGTGSVNTGGGVTSAMLTGYADSTGNLIQGVTLPAAGLTKTGAALALANDLASLEAASSVNTIYYRSATDTWSAVTIGTGLTFTGGTLTATGGGGAGDVTQAGNNVFTGSNYFTNTVTIGSSSSPLSPTGFKVQIVNNTVANQQWSNDAFGPVYNFMKAHNTVGTYGTALLDDQLGAIQFHGADGVSAFLAAAQIRAFADINFNPTNASGRIEFWTRQGTGALTKRMMINSGGTAYIGAGVPGFGGGLGLFQIDTVSAGTGTITLTNYQAANGAPSIKFRHSRGALNAHGVTVAAQDPLGSFYFEGNDGTQFVKGAEINVVTESVPSSSFVDASIRFTNFRAGQGYTEKLRIWPSGCITANPLANTTDGGLGCFYGSLMRVHQSADNLGQGFTFDNAAQDANAYILIGGTSNPNSPRDIAVITNYPGTGVTIWNAGDMSKPTAIMRPGGCSFIGVSDGSNASAAYVGEYATPVTFNSVSVPSGTTANVASISLTAGDWDVWAQGFVFAGGAATFSGTGFNTISGTMPAGLGNYQTQYLNQSVNMGTAALSIRSRFSLAATTTVYLVGNSAAVAVSWSGAIFARRIR